jgi:ABC-type lipoprotein release transport system permease subunit
VVIVTSFYETTRRAITEEVVDRWLGSAHITVHPPGAHWGTLDASLAEPLAKLDHVEHVTARLTHRVHLVWKPRQDRLVETGWRWVDAIGIDPASEQHFLTLPNVQGRTLQSGDRGVAVIERELACAWGVELGDPISLANSSGDVQTPFTVVGLFDSRRVAEFQQPPVYVPLGDLQELAHAKGAASAIDIMLDDVSPEALAAAQQAVERCIAERNLSQTCRIETAAARQMVVGEAERITRLMLVLIALVAMLTSFFIILTTQSMSLMARRSQLGAMRCVGTTRAQLAALLLGELMPCSASRSGSRRPISQHTLRRTRSFDSA